MALLDLFMLLGSKRSPRAEIRHPVATPGLIMAPTACGDEAGIAKAVRDFLAHPAS